MSELICPHCGEKVQVDAAELERMYREQIDELLEVLKQLEIKDSRREHEAL